MEYELYHYGRKGMRWYQNIFTKGKEAAAARKKRKAAKEKEAEEKRKVNVEEQKKQIRNSRSAELVYKNAHLFNDKELTEIYNRLNTENNIKNLIPAKVNKGKKFIENTASTTKNIGTLVGNTTDMINKFKAFGKLFGGDKAKTASGNANAQKSDAGKTKTKTEKTKDEKVERVTNFEILDRVSKATSSRQSNRPKDIIDYDDYDGGRPSYDATKLAQTLVRNVGSRTVKSVMNNADSVSSVDDYLLSIGVRRVTP